MGRVLRFSRLRNNYWLEKADSLKNKMTNQGLHNDTKPKEVRFLRGEM